MSKNSYSQAKFLKSASKIEQLPKDVGYEVAFVGRSNAGKSSALNCLTGIQNLARTSKLPGRTRLINIFTLGEDSERRLIDLPGYGYAKVPLQMKLDWQETLAQYLEERQCLQGLIVLMDIRHPLKELDEMLISWAIRRGLPIHILLTKADKLSRGQAQSTVLQVKQQYSMFETSLSVQAFSSLKKQGVEDLASVLNTWFKMSLPFDADPTNHQ